MFECKYKLTEQDCIVSAKYVFKSGKRKRDKVIAVLIPVLMVCMVAMLVFDIVTKKSYAWDIVLLCALAVLQIIYAIIPLTIVHSQKKSFKKQNLGEMDYLLIAIDDNLCTETLYKNNQEVAKDMHNLKSLTSYIEDNLRIVLVFNKVEFVCLRKDGLTGSVNQLKNHLEKIMSKQNSSKKK